MTNEELFSAEISAERAFHGLSLFRYNNDGGAADLCIVFADELKKLFEVRDDKKAGTGCSATEEIESAKGDPDDGRKRAKSFGDNE